MPTALDPLGWPCTLVAAPAGYGKTSAVRRLLATATVRWHPSATVGSVDPGFVDAALMELVRQAVRADAPYWLVLDDLPRLTGPTLTALLRAVERMPEGMRLVLITRHLPAPRTLDAARRRGLLGRLGPADLAMSRSQVAAVLRGDYQLPDPDLARPVHRLTGGWPILVHLLARAVRDGAARGESLDSVLREDDPPGGDYLAREVLAALPADQRRVLRRAAYLDPVDPELCDSGRGGQATRLLPRLAESGLLTPDTSHRAGYVVLPLVAMAVRRALPLPARQVTELLTRAAGWYSARDRPAAALRCYRLIGAHAELTRLLRRDGERLVVAGAAPAVITAVEALPGTSRPAWLRRLQADALRVRGETEAAAAIYRRLVGQGATAPANLAWRYGLLHYLRGEPREALAILTRGRVGDERSIDEALLLGWSGCAYAQVGDATACADRARRALAAGTAIAATTPGRPEALTVGHVAASLAAALGGEPSAALGHLAEADRLARDGYDAGLRAWVRVHLAYARVAEARYPAALAEADDAVDQAEAAGCPAMQVRALAARAGALVGQGRLDDAMASYQRAAALAQRTGAPQVAQVLVGIGELQLRQGRDALAQAAYEEAVRLGEATGDQVVLARALTGLARVAVRDDASHAVALATRAVAAARGADGIQARCALGWAALADGDLARAGRLVDEATALARAHHDRAGLAAVLELRAATAHEPESAQEALSEAVAIFRDAGAWIDADRLIVLLGRLPGAGTVAQIEARLAAERLAQAGLPAPAGFPAPIARRPAVAPVTVHTLGRFEVIVEGRTVPTSAWQSRKARDLLRILTAQRGRPMSREQLAELLWPGEAPDRVGHRLSVQLSILRGVLDPHRRAPQDRYVVAERASVALDTTYVELDVELFRAEASYGLRHFETGRGQDGADVLTLAERRYLGDFLADEPYDDWAVPVRDEARRLYLRVVRALAVLARRRGDLEQASSRLRRALEVDPYDENTHRELVAVLVAAGRHGEAEEAQRRYQRAMALLGVPAQPKSAPERPGRVP